MVAKTPNKEIETLKDKIEKCKTSRPNHSAEGEFLREMMPTRHAIRNPGRLCTGTDKQARVRAVIKNKHSQFRMLPLRMKKGLPAEGRVG